MLFININFLTRYADNCFLMDTAVDIPINYPINDWRAYYTVALKSSAYYLFINIRCYVTFNILDDGEVI